MHWALSSFNCTFDGNAQPRKLCLTTHNIKEGLIDYARLDDPAGVQIVIILLFSHYWPSISSPIFH
ncbi:hypothetical protein JHK85_003674 [Glycine max]|uniref:Uncharacterized protein n=1 Tax=Glycine soja TaxID=3848 RepID=A0A445LLC5_GLYSO|nr:hypothetical protein JHK85_003674 [Glycine max]RZC23942.1 hypothetical protein D0Y65_003310 [Glycine soja]